MIRSLGFDRPERTSRTYSMVSGQLRRSALLLVASLGSFSIAAWAHDPHQVIDDVEIAILPNGETGIFIINDHYRLQISTDGKVWRHLAKGLDNWLPLTDIALAPDLRESGLIALGSEGSGVYLSEDAGASWRRSSSGPDTARAVAIVADDGRHAVLAASAAGGLYRSVDGGGSWTKVIAQEGEVTALQATAEGLVYAGDAAGAIYRSGDLGETWEQLAEVADSGGITAFAVVAADQTLLVGTGRAGIYSTPLGTVVLTPVNEGLAELPVQSIAVSPGDRANPLIVATTWHQGAHISSDGGHSWRLAAEGLFSDSQADTPAYFSPHYREVRFVPSGSRAGTAFLAGYDGLFSSGDPSQGWQSVHTFHDGRVFAVGAGPGPNGQDTVLFSTYFTGIYYADEPLNGWRKAEVNAPIRKLRASEYHFLPQAAGPGRVFSILDGGDELLSSGNGGRTWQAVRLPPDTLVDLRVRTLRRLHRMGVPAKWTVDTLRREDAFTAWPRGIALSPRFAEDRTLYVITRHRGLYVSADGGKSMTRVSSNLQEYWDIAAGEGPEAGTDLFTSVRDQGVFRSIDGGKHWEPISQGLAFLDDWRTFRATPFGEAEFRRSEYFTIRLAVSPAYAEDHTVFAGGGAGLYRSTNRGEHWERLVARGLGANPFLLAFTLSPRFQEDQTILASVKGRGLFRSRDGGASFQLLAPAILDANQDVFHVHFGGYYPLHPTLYAASLEELWRSTDDGGSWEILDRPGRQ